VAGSALGGMELDGEASKLAERVVELVGELEEEENVDEGFDEFKAKKRDAERMLTQGSAADALGAAMKVLETLIAVTKLKEEMVKARLREITWLAKDAAGLFKEMGEKKGRVLALMALARSHLLRASEPDAPMAALKASREASNLFSEVADKSLQADALCLLAEAHTAKAASTPFDKVLVEEVSAAVKAAREAEDLFKELDDKPGIAKAMHVQAKALLRHSDEDEVLDGERIADEARELYHELGDNVLEVAVLMTGMTARHATSGPESALMMAKDAAEDWQQEGGRPKDVALAHLLAAGFQLELSEHEDALKCASDAQALYEKVGDRRSVAQCLETKSAVHAARKHYDEALKALDDMATLFQKIGDKKAQGAALSMAANLLLNQLSDEVEKDTEAESEKKTPVFNLIDTDVERRSAMGMEYANEATKCYEEAGDDEGVKTVAELIKFSYEKAIQIYCKSNEPDQIYYTLSKDGPLEDTSKCIKEWKIPIKEWQKDGSQQGDGFLHVFDPHPPPGMAQS